MTVERKPLFPNVLVEVFSQGHLDAVFKEAESLGYTHSQDYNTVFQQQPKPWTTIAHFGSNAELFIFTAFTKDEANEWHKLAAAGSTVYKDYLGAEFKPLRKVRIEYNKLNTVVESRDNQAVLAVLPRKKHEVAVVEPFDKLLKATQEDNDKVIWVRPKAENPIVTKVVRFLAVAGSKVVNATKRVVKYLRGGL